MADPPPPENEGDGRNDGAGGPPPAHDVPAASPQAGAPQQLSSQGVSGDIALGDDFMLFRSRTSLKKERRQHAKNATRMGGNAPDAKSGPTQDGGTGASKRGSPSSTSQAAPRDRSSATARQRSQRPMANDKRKKLTVEDKRILQLRGCVSKIMPTDEVTELFARVQRAFRTKAQEEAATFARVYDRTNPEDCVALRTILQQWFAPTEASPTGISIQEFKQRLQAIRLITEDAAPLARVPLSWKATLLNSMEQQPLEATTSGAGLDSEATKHATATQLAHDLLGPAAPLRSRLALRAAIEARDHVRLIARLEGTMKPHANVQRKGILRQLISMTERLKAQNDEFKSTVLRAYYDASSNWVVFTFPSLDVAVRWLNVEIPLQGRMLPLQLPPVVNSQDDPPLGLYPIQVFDTSSQLSALNLLHLFEDTLGISVKSIESAPPDVEGWTDPSSFVVTLAHKGCPVQLNGRSYIVWNGATLWMQHMLFAASPLCTQCVDPEYTRSRCKRNKLQTKYRLAINASAPTVLEEIKKEAPTRPAVFQPWVHNFKPNPPTMPVSSLTKTQLRERDARRAEYIQAERERVEPEQRDGSNVDQE